MVKLVNEGVSSTSDSESIVDRLEQRNAFVDVIDRMQSGMPFPYILFEWFGAPGIGKTTLITLLVDECKQRQIPYALIDFSKAGEEKNKAYSHDPILLIEDLIGEFEQYGIATEIIRKKILSYRETLVHSDIDICTAYARMTSNERYYSGPDWLDEMRDVISAFKDSILTIPGETGQSGHARPLALFIDSVDDANESLADWMEEFLVKTMVQTKRCAVVWAARYPWKWKLPEIRWARKSEELLPFNEEEVKEQLSASPRFKGETDLAEKLFQNVFTLTGGHPYAGAVVIKQIDGWEHINAEALKQHESELYREINKQVIKEYAFGGHDQDVSNALELCSMIRLIDTTILQHILQESGGGKFKSWQRKDFEQLFYGMRKTYLLKWKNNKGWVLQQSLRHLTRSFYLYCAPDIFQKVNSIALKVHQDWLARPVDNRGLFLMEELYHYMSLQQLNVREKDLATVLDERLEQYPSQIREDTDGWQHTLEQIAGEIEHDEEFIQLIGEQAIRQLIAPITKRIEIIKKQKK